MRRTEFIVWINHDDEMPPGDMLSDIREALENDGQSVHDVGWISGQVIVVKECQYCGQPWDNGESHLHGGDLHQPEADENGPR